MGFMDKLMFWKRDSLDDLGSFGKGNDFGNMGMTPGKDLGDMGNFDQGFGNDNNNNLALPGQQNYGQDNMGLPPSKGIPDVSNFRGVGDGDLQSQNAMNQSIHRQLGPDYMNNDSSGGFGHASPGQAYQQPSRGGNQDIEIVSAKLDAIRATLDSINQRLMNLERVAYGEQDDRRRGQW